MKDSCVSFPLYMCACVWSFLKDSCVRSHLQLFACLLVAQQYIKVLSRPLAQNKSDHHVWSAVYLDYPTEQSEITTSPMSFMTSHIDAAHEDQASFKVDYEHQ